MSTAARVTPPAGSPAGTEAVDNACGSWLAAADCVAETRAGPTSHGSSSHSKSTGAQDCSMHAGSVGSAIALSANLNFRYTGSRF
jgi:hypothetical protein